MNYIPTAKEREKAERTDRSDPERVKVTLKHYLAPFSAWMKAFVYYLYYCLCSWHPCRPLENSLTQGCLCLLTALSVVL